MLNHSNSSLKMFRFEEDGEKKLMGWKPLGLVAGLTGKMYSEALHKRPTLTIHYATGNEFYRLTLIHCLIWLSGANILSKNQ